MWLPLPDAAEWLQSPVLSRIGARVQLLIPAWGRYLTATRRRLMPAPRSVQSRRISTRTSRARSRSKFRTAFAPNAANFATLLLLVAVRPCVSMVGSPATAGTCAFGRGFALFGILSNRAGVARNRIQPAQVHRTLDHVPAVTRCVAVHGRTPGPPCAVPPTSREQRATSKASDATARISAISCWCVLGRIPRPSRAVARSRSRPLSDKRGRRRCRRAHNRAQECRIAP